MFRRFRPKIRVYGNRRHGCSFKATINFLVWNHVELVGLQNCYLRFRKFGKFLKISKIFNIFFLFKISPHKIKIFNKKTENILEGNGWWICAQNFKSISSCMYIHVVITPSIPYGMTEIYLIWSEKKQALFTSFRDLTVIFRILFFDRFWCFKKCFRIIFRVLSENLT